MKCGKKGTEKEAGFGIDTVSERLLGRLLLRVFFDNSQSQFHILDPDVKHTRTGDLFRLFSYPDNPGEKRRLSKDDHSTLYC